MLTIVVYPVAEKEGAVRKVAPLHSVTGLQL